MPTPTELCPDPGCLQGWDPWVLRGRKLRWLQGRVSHIWPFSHPVDCSPPGSSVHGISQARTLEWVAIPFAGGSSRPGDGTLHGPRVSCISRQILYRWLSHEAEYYKTNNLSTRTNLPALSLSLPCYTKEGAPRQSSPSGRSRHLSCYSKLGTCLSQKAGEKRNTLYCLRPMQSRTPLQCRTPGFGPRVGKIPWRREWQPTPGFLPGELHEQSSLAGYSPWGHKDLDTTEWLNFISFYAHPNPII